MGGGACPSATRELARDARGVLTRHSSSSTSRWPTLAGFGPTVDAAVSHPEVFVAMLAGDLARAERHLKAGRRLLEQMGERAVLASTEGYLAQVHWWPDATARRTGTRDAAPPSRRTTTPRRRSSGARCAARVLARRGEARRALELAREAVEIAMTTDHLNIQGDAMVDLATSGGSRVRMRPKPPL